MAVSKEDIARLREAAEWNQKHGDPDVAKSMKVVADTIDQHQREEAAGDD